MRVLLPFITSALCFTGAAATWAYPTDTCPRAGAYADIVSLKAFEFRGGKLVPIKSPNLSNIKPSEGYGTFHLVVLIDGTAFVEGADGVTLNMDYSMMMHRRFGAMRYAPPKLAGKPVCVGFDIAWKAQNPQSFEMISR